MKKWTYWTRPRHLVYHFPGKNRPSPLRRPSSRHRYLPGRVHHPRNTVAAGAPAANAEREITSRPPLCIQRDLKEISDNILGPCFGMTVRTITNAAPQWRGQQTLELRAPMGPGRDGDAEEGTPMKGGWSGCIMEIGCRNPRDYVQDLGAGGAESGLDLAWRSLLNRFRWMCVSQRRKVIPRDLSFLLFLGWSALNHFEAENIPSCLITCVLM